jgi:hypothetical protein
MRTFIGRFAFLGAVLLGSMVAIPAGAASACSASDAVCLNVPFVSQFAQGRPQNNNTDCGAAAVSQVLYFFAGGKSQFNGSDADLIQAVRDGAGKQSGDLWVSEVQAALQSFGVNSNTIPYSTNADDTIRAIKDDINYGIPVIALIHGADLNRGEAYQNHWVVVIGYTQNGSMIVNDPDDLNGNNAQHTPGWILGGPQLVIDGGRFRNALVHAHDPSNVSAVYPTF